MVLWFYVWAQLAVVLVLNVSEDVATAGTSGYKASGLSTTPHKKIVVVYIFISNTCGSRNVVRGGPNLTAVFFVVF